MATPEMGHLCLAPRLTREQTPHVVRWSPSMVSRTSGGKLRGGGGGQFMASGHECSSSQAVTHVDPMLA